MIPAKKYWFYLEPFCFIFRGENQTIVYNTLNSAYIVCPPEDIIDHLMNSLLEKGSGYTAQISDQDLENPTISSFIKCIRDTFSGDVLDVSQYPNKPFIFKPIARLRDNFHLLKDEDRYDFIGNNVLRYLKEVSLFINSTCAQSCPKCDSYYRQFSFCSQSNEKHELSLQQCTIILDRLENSGTSLVKILGGNILNYTDILKLSAILNSYSFKKQFYIHYKNIPSGKIPLILDEKSSIVVLINSPFDTDKLAKVLQLLNKNDIELFFTVSSKEDFETVEKFLEENPLYRISIKPFFDGTNMKFFEQNVFNNLNDIIDTPVDKKSIFRRLIVNEHFFGKLTVMPNGDVYSSVNNHKLGNAVSDTLNRLVFKEIDTKQSWFKTRDTATPCQDCCNKYLCPSLSDYEQVLDRDNLCNMIPHQCKSEPKAHNTHVY